MCVFAWRYVCTPHVLLNWPEGGIRYPGTLELSYCCELPIGCWKPNLCPLKEYQMFLTIEPFPALFIIFFILSISLLFWWTWACFINHSPKDIGIVSRLSLLAKFLFILIVWLYISICIRFWWLKVQFSVIFVGGNRYYFSVIQCNSPKVGLTTRLMSQLMR